MAIFWRRVGAGSPRWYKNVSHHKKRDDQEICIHFPHLKPAEVHSTLAYYFDHPSEIEAEIDEEQRLIEESRKNAKPTPVELRLRTQGLLPPR